MSEKLSGRLIGEWNHARNVIDAQTVTSGSHAKVWWICEEGHEWEAKIANRSSGRNCPVCSNRMIIAGVNDLATIDPQLAETWHPTKNNGITPAMVSTKSQKKIWWLCDKGHGWQAAVSSRSYGSGCPVCANKILLRGFNDLATTDPQLAETWHPTKNGELLPTMITRSSARRVWWLCEKGHEWETILYSRTNSATNCSYCSNRKVLKGSNDLATTHPDLAKEWHPTRNGNLTNEMVAAGSSKKVWWLGECEHEWEASLGARLRGRDCPVCVSKKVLSGYNDLQTKNPELAAEWHPMKNGDVTPEMVMNQSNKVAWWLGHCGHGWEAKISTRARHGCPICSGRQVMDGYNDIFTTHSWLREFWDEDMNAKENNSLPNKGSDNKVYWKCPKGHSWKTVAHALIAGARCPVCSGHKCVAGVNDLQTTHPDLAKEWHLTKNGDILPTSIIAGSEYKAWWQCIKGHEWESKVETRKYNSTSCPTCWASDRISKSEKEILDFLTNLGLVVEHSNRQILNNKQEIDFYLPEKKIGIEFNGLYWHSEAAGRSEQYHRAKWLAAKKVGVQLIQLWEDDWRDRKQVVMRTIAHRLGVELKLNELSIETVKLSVSEMKVMSLTGEQAKHFLTQNHIDGFVSGSHYLGLTDVLGVIRSVMVLKETPNQTLNILRYAGYGRSAGFAKLLNYAECVYKPNFFTADADHCANEEILYEDNNFMVEKEITPDFMYLFKAVRNHRLDYNLERFQTDPALQWEAGLNESGLAELNKFHRIWDAGKTSYKKKC